MIAETDQGARTVSANSLFTGRRLGDLNPGRAVNPNRISSPIHRIPDGDGPCSAVPFLQVRALRVRRSLTSHPGLLRPVRARIVRASCVHDSLRRLGTTAARSSAAALATSGKTWM